MIPTTPSGFRDSHDVSAVHPSLELGSRPSGPMTVEELNARLLYRDGLMLVIDKPTGIAVHRGPKGGENLEDYFPALRFGLPRNPALVHRLDRDTSGCLVLGRHRKALEKLGLLFKQGKIAKIYWAIVEASARRRLDRSAARASRSRSRLVDEGGSLGPPFANILAGLGALGRSRVSGACAAHRAHSPTSGSLRGARLADPGRCDLWAWRGDGLAASRQGDHGSAI
jgi:hypothetical protein